MLKEEEATGEVAQIFEEIRRTMQLPIVPNFFRAQGRSLSMLTNTWNTACQVLMSGALPRTLKEMLFVAVSVARGCQYCASAHLAFCKMMGVSETTLTALARDLNAVSPQRTQDILKFAVKCATEPVHLTAEDYDKVRQHGVSEVELMEVITAAGVATYFDVLADALKLDVDPLIVEALGGRERIAQQFGMSV
jgi:uncharacterized peroxidase-related enzyme